MTTLCLLRGARAPAHERVDFKTEVLPILQRSCGGAECHVGQRQSGVDLTGYEALMASRGDQYEGLIVIPGQPDESPIIDKVSSLVPRFGDPMPFDGDPLTAPEVDLLRRWIEEGAVGRHTPLRGDINQDDILNLTDGIVILTYLFLGGIEPQCLLLADADGDGLTNLTDPIFVLNYLFSGGPSPVELTDEEWDSCQAATELSYASIYEKVFAASCAFSSCHSGARAKGSLDLGNIDAAYAALVGAAPANETALAAGLLRVDPGKPASSFLLRKLGAPGPGEGNRMPANSSSPLPDSTLSAIREWILAGAPREGTIPGVPDISEELPPPTGHIPQPTPPENGIQLHLEPFTIGAGREREVFYYVDKPFAAMPGDVYVQRIDIHMSEESHHFIIYEWINPTKPPSGIRDSSFADFLASQRFIVGSQQSFYSLSFPPGVGIKFTKDTSFDFNSHYINLSGDAPFLGEVYVNIFFAEPGAVTTIAKPIFDINTSINVPPNQTRTTKLNFPSFTSSAQDPALGNNGRVARETHIYSLSSHMHRHGVRFQVFLINNGVDVNPPQLIYDNLDWDDPLFLRLDPPLVLQAGQGLRYETTHTYDDPPTPTSPPLRFAATSEDEMAILLGFYSQP